MEVWKQKRVHINTLTFTNLEKAMHYGGYLYTCVTLLDDEIYTFNVSNKSRLFAVILLLLIFFFALNIYPCRRCNL